MSAAFHQFHRKRCVIVVVAGLDSKEELVAQDKEGCIIQDLCLSLPESFGHTRCGGHGVESQEHHGRKGLETEANRRRSGGGAESSVEGGNGGVAVGNRDFGMGIWLHDAGFVEKCDCCVLTINY